MYLQFEKADADLDQLSRKLDAEFANETDEAGGQVCLATRDIFLLHWIVQLCGKICGMKYFPEY